MSVPPESWQTRSIVRTMFPLLVVLSTIVLVAGITLEEAQGLLAEYGILAIMVPTMINLGGNLGAILSSRLSTRLHLGTRIDPRNPALWGEIGAILALAVTVFSALTVAATALGHLLGMPLPLVDLLVITLTSGMAVALVAIALSFAATYGSYRLGVDPDDATIPIVTNVVDVFGMIIFIAIAAVVLG